MYREADEGPDLPLDFIIQDQLRLTLTTVQHAVTTGRGMLAYQPVMQVDHTDRPAFYEGLIRILDETGRVVPLSDFMPYAEATDLGRQIDCLSLSLGLQTLVANPDLRLSINMSARSMNHPEWLETLHWGTGTDDRIAERLVLEVTESSAMGLPDLVIPFMREWQARGVSFAIDDFGAGYTSFRYLRDFCFDMIKIDGQFIRDIAHHPDNQVLVAALISIAHHFDMFTVAEAVETADEADFLARMGVDCLQGFHFGLPSLVAPAGTVLPLTRAH